MIAGVGGVSIDPGARGVCTFGSPSRLGCPLGTPWETMQQSHDGQHISASGAFGDAEHCANGRPEEANHNVPCTTGTAMLSGGTRA
jgi:hypothetical protein